jgi:FkbM family methyltransferase
MLKTIWRSQVAPRLIARLAPRVWDALRPEVIKLAQAERLAEPVSSSPPAFPDGISELQVYRGYEDDDTAVFKQFTAANRIAQPGFVVDFLGGRTRVAMLYDQVAPLDGCVLEPPVPGDFHAEAIEWLGLLKTVKTARSRYTAMEWGAGWAPWLVAGAIAARAVGITTSRLYGVEADPEHVASMRQHFLDNDLDPSGHVLLQAAVGPETGVARWPRYPDARNMWGARPLRHGSREDEDYPNPATHDFLEIEILKASELLLREPVWDMLHIDIQGWEGAVCRSCIDQMTERVRWVILGVHSRILDAELLRLFHSAGWILEHEKPTRFRFAPDKATFESMVIADGTQIWRNPRLVP